LAVGPSQHAVGGAPVAVFRQPDAGDVGEEQPPDAAGVGDVQVAEGEYGDAVRDAGQQGCDPLFLGQGAQVVVEVLRVGVDDQHRLERQQVAVDIGEDRETPGARAEG